MIYDVRAKLSEYERDYSTKDEVIQIQDKIFERMDNLKSDYVSVEDFDSLKLVTSEKAHFSRIDELNTRCDSIIYNIK